MGYTSEDLYLACDCCKRARQNKYGDWYCSARQDDYFPGADWDADIEDESECPKFEFDPDCYNDDY